MVEIQRPNALIDKRMNIEPSKRWSEVTPTVILFEVGTNMQTKKSLHAEDFLEAPSIKDKYRVLKKEVKGQGPKVRQSSFLLLNG